MSDEPRQRTATSCPEELERRSGYVGPYQFPDNSRRRIPGVLYLVIAALCVLVWLAGSDSLAWVNDGFLWAALALTVAGVISITSGWRMHVDETEALISAQRRRRLPGRSRVGPAGVARIAQPADVARALLLDRGPAPARGLVLVDAVDGTVVEALVEDNPERWSFDARSVRSKTRSLHSVELVSGCAAPRCWRRRASSPRPPDQGATAPRTPRRRRTARRAPTGSELERTRMSVETR